MRDRLRPSRLGALVPAAASLIILTGCSGESGGTGPCSTPNQAPAGETALLPSGLSFDKFGTVTHVEKSLDNITVQGVANKPLDELTVLIQEAVTAAGYQPSGMDSEDNEAEVFFTAGSFAAGQAKVRRGDCAGRWSIELVLIDPNTSAPPSTH